MLTSIFRLYSLCTLRPGGHLARRQFKVWPSFSGQFFSPNARMVSSITTIHTTDSYAPIGHYSQAFSANGQVWIAGQIAADVDGNLIKGSMTEQAHQICKNIDEILKAAGSDLKRTVKVFVTDFDQLPEFNAVYNTYFPHKPPRTSVEVSRLPLDVTAEVDIIAVTK